MTDLPPNFGKLDENPVPFGDRLSGMVALEMSLAAGDPERMAAVLERLLHSVSFTIAIMGAGNRTRTENLITGAEAYLAEGAVGLSKFGEFMSRGGQR